MFQTPWSFSRKMKVNAERGLFVPSQLKRQTRQSTDSPKCSLPSWRTWLLIPSEATTRSASRSSSSRDTSVS